MIFVQEVRSNGESETQSAISGIPNGLTELDSEFDRIEATFSAIASQYQLPHRRLLALDWASRYHGISAGTFKKAFAMWLESSTAEGEIDD